MSLHITILQLLDSIEKYQGSLQIFQKLLDEDINRRSEVRHGGWSGGGKGEIFWAVRGWVADIMIGILICFILGRGMGSLMILGDFEAFHCTGFKY